jgi:UDP-N-acetyl-D-glucosamine dehydrogenase
VRGSKILILGVSYKASVGDTRESPALKIIKLLQKQGGKIVYHDPHVPSLPELELDNVSLEEGMRGADLVCIVTAHPSVDHDKVVAEAPLVLDFRGITRGKSAANVVRL